MLIFSLVSAVAEAFVPYLAGRVFDAIIKVARDPSLALGAIALIIAVWYLLKVITDLADWKISSGEAQLGIELYSEYIAQSYGKLLLMPMSFHKTKKRGEISERINRAADWLSDIVENVLVRLSPRFLSVLVAVVITFFINAYLALILLAAVVLYAVILLNSVGDLAYMQRRMYRGWSRAYGVAHDALENIQEIKQATAENFEARRISRSFISVASRFWLELNLVLRRLNLFQRVIISLAQLAIFSVSVFLVREKTITPGELVAFNGYAAMLFGPFVALGQNWSTIQNGFVAIGQSEKILALPSEVYVPENAVILPDIRGGVRFEKVSFVHDQGKAVLRNVSFEVRPGEVVALVGESGVGKTTLIELILAFHFPTRGKIFIDGHDVRNLDLKNYRSKIATVPQEISLFNDTVLMNIRYGNFGASDEKARRAAEEAHASDFIESFPKKYRQLVGWRGVKLSTGQKQRVAIARAILRDPSILILDEPTSALDAKSEDIIKASLAKLMRGRTTFIIAHRLSTVQHADKIIVLDKGTIAEVGRHEELLQRGGIYRRLYDIQFSGRLKK
ncbi:MAG: ABC transporter ATP-binding protein [Candidatus Sungbacteria bacterium]|nr:ABC transporter ATP-binding protein [Candidatus Sungbacteria bacterium]